MITVIAGTINDLAYMIEVDLPDESIDQFRNELESFITNFKSKEETLSDKEGSLEGLQFGS